MIAVFLISTLGTNKAFAQWTAAPTITESQACHCILGEARSEYSKHGYEAFLAVAEVIRRRGSTKGIYGCKASFSKELGYIKAMGLDDEALRAWKASKDTNITMGAIMFENIIDFGKPSWYDSYKETVTIGKHTFFKEKNNAKIKNKS